MTFLKAAKIKWFIKKRNRRRSIICQHIIRNSRNHLEPIHQINSQSRCHSIQGTSIIESANEKSRWVTRWSPWCSSLATIPSISTMPNENRRSLQDQRPKQTNLWPFKKIMTPRTLATTVQATRWEKTSCKDHSKSSRSLWIKSRWGNQILTRPAWIPLTTSNITWSSKSPSSQMTINQVASISSSWARIN